MSRSQQRKGRSGELELAAILNQHGFTVRPGTPLNYGTEPDLVGIQNVHAEVKRVERLNVPEALKQAIRDSERFRDGMPVLFHRRNREGWIVSMRLSDWIVLYRRGVKRMNDEPGIFIESNDVPAPEITKEHPNVPMITREDVP